MAPDDDDISLSSDSSSSSEESASNSSEGESIKEAIEDAQDGCWRQLVFATICVLGCTVLFTTIVLMLGDQNDNFETSVSFSINKQNSGRLF